MKKTRHIIIALVAFFTCGAAGAQSLGGVLTRAAEFGTIDMLTLSQYNTTLSTARASAMGGAFTSLGGDLASMSINPAGIAMYRGTTYGFSPALNFSGTDSSYSPGRVNSDRFSFNNIGTVITTHTSSRALTNLNFGFSYNKLADYNYSYEAGMPAGKYSLGNLMAYQLQGLNQYIAGNGWDPISLGVLKDKPFYNTDIYPSEWGAILGYNTGLVTPVNPNDPDQVLYGVAGLDRLGMVAPNMYVKSRGSVGEYNFTVGMNFGNKFYLGVGLTIQDIYMKQDIYYTEEFVNNAGDGSPSNLKEMQYDQQVKMSGTGLNFKVGAIYRPIPSLRIGLAVHTPTWTSITHEYSADMRTFFQNSPSASDYTPLNYYDYDYRSPARLMAGVSYTIGDFAAISVDYEKVWYNGMRLTSGNHYIKEAYKEDIKTFRAADNVKAGIEFKPIPAIALRAGYSYAGSPVDKDYFYVKPVVTETHNISAGVGFRLGHTTNLDFAYVYSRNTYCGFDMYYYKGSLGAGGEDTGNNAIMPEQSITDLKLDRHTAIMTLGFTF